MRPISGHRSPSSGRGAAGRSSFAIVVPIVAVVCILAGPVIAGDGLRAGGARPAPKAAPAGGAAAERGDAPAQKESPKLSLLELIASAGVSSTRSKAERLKSTIPSFDGVVDVPDESRLYGWIRELCAQPHRRPGTDEGHRAEAWVARRFEELGLKRVTRDRFPLTVWNATEWSFRVEDTRIPCFFILNTGFTPSGGVTAPLVYVGEGGLRGFAGQKPRGKIVVAEAAMSPERPDRIPALLYSASDPEGHLASDNQHLALPRNVPVGYPSTPLADVVLQAQAAGAVGIAVILRDYGSALNTLYWPPSGSARTLPGVYVGKRDGTLLREWAKMGKTATLVLRGTTELGWTSNVWGMLPGASEEVILIASHHDSPHRGAVAGGCGVAQLLGQAWAWSRLPQERRPRTLAFLAAGGHAAGGVGAREFALRNAEVMRRVRAALCLEHLGGKEVKEGRNGAYEETGRHQASVIYLPRQPDLVGAILKAFEACPPPATVARPPGLAIPLGEAARLVGWAAERGSGYSRSGGLPYASWTSAPLYLLDEEDTLERVDRKRLAQLAGAVTEIVKSFAVLE